MRQIIFRGKRADRGAQGKWVYGDLSVLIYNPEHDPHGCQSRIETDIYTHDAGKPWSGSIYSVDPDTVGQYTGLTDKNSKKIFEGDIVRRLDVIQVERETGKVGFDEVCCCFYLTVNNGLGRRGIFRDAEYEVIGNIYDNPELLEGTT